ncbi:MAG TPA: alpha/beta hydrolase-fold protein [Candidatus Didemnitutus sp.]|nr:alpha/beta hydrolase-fold protein [Candidatus Didemnitutus sp.]
MNGKVDLAERLAGLLRRMGLGEAAVRTEMFGDFPAPGLAPREITVYLPPTYRPGSTWPLLIALDGQNMARWRLGPTLENLAAGNAIDPPVVISVPASADRVDEYGTAGLPDFMKRGRLAEAFQAFLTNEVVPAVRKRYGAGVDPARTGIFGASMGGLCAFDTAWRHPQVFGFAGIFSGSLWWRGDDSSPAAQQASRLAHRRVRETSAKPPVRFWFQAGTADEDADRDDNGVIDAIQDTTELIDTMVAHGFQRERDVFFTETRRGRHHEATWARELPKFFGWALPPKT